MSRMFYLNYILGTNSRNIADVPLRNRQTFAIAHTSAGRTQGRGQSKKTIALKALSLIVASLINSAYKTFR